MDESGTIAIRITEASNLAEVANAVRGATGASLAEVHQCVQQREPITIGKLFHASQSDVYRNAAELMHRLDRMGAKFEILINGQIQTHAGFHAMINQMSRMSDDVETVEDINIDTASIESLSTLRKEFGQEYFRRTLQDIVNGEGYSVDRKTLEWVHLQLNAEAEAEG